MRFHRALLLFSGLATQTACACFGPEAAAYRPVARLASPVSSAAEPAPVTAGTPQSFYVQRVGGPAAPEPWARLRAGGAAPSPAEPWARLRTEAVPNAVFVGRAGIGATESPGSDSFRAEPESEQQAPPDYRDPGKALCYACLLAGGGHFYTGETTRGAVLLGVAAAALIGGAALSGGSDDPFACEYEFESHECGEAGGRTPLLVGAGIAAASWVYGIVDSRRSAARVNQRSGRIAGERGVAMRPWVDLRSGREAAGLNIAVTW